MKVGALVRCIYQFSCEKRQYPKFSYPNKGDILTVATISAHPIHDFNLLTFEEIKTLPLCSLRFREIKFSTENIKQINELIKPESVKTKIVCQN